MTIKDQEMLQWTLNGFLTAGSTGEVRLRDVQQWLDPLPDDFADTLALWIRDGYIEVVRPIGDCKPKDVCFRLLKPFKLPHE